MDIEWCESSQNVKTDYKNESWQSITQWLLVVPYSNDPTWVLPFNAKTFRIDHLYWNDVGKWKGHPITFRNFQISNTVSSQRLVKMLRGIPTNLDGATWRRLLNKVLLQTRRPRVHCGGALSANKRESNGGVIGWKLGVTAPRSQSPSHSINNGTRPHSRHLAKVSSP